MDSDKKHATIKIKQRSNGMFYFLFCAPTGLVMARSEDYASMAAAYNGARSLIDLAPNAEIENQTEY